MPSCLIIVASICLPWANGEVSITNTSLLRAAQWRTDAGEVDIHHSSDNINFPDWSSVASACGDHGCVDYARADHSDAKSFVTHLVIRRPNCGLGQDIYVRPRQPWAATGCLARSWSFRPTRPPRRPFHSPG